MAKASRKNQIKVISVINMKGGVGKTTLAVNFAAALARFHSKRVLLIDVDPQFNATQYVVKQEQYVEHIKNKLTVLDIFRPRASEGPGISKTGSVQIATPSLDLSNVVFPVSDKGGGKLDLIPSTLELMELENSTRGTEYKLQHFIDSVKASYDFVIIDCPPTMSIFNLSAFLASDAYLIPLKPDHLSSIGLPLLERALEQYSTDYAKSIAMLGIVFTMVEGRKTNLMEETMATLSASKHCFKTCLRRSTQVASAVKNNKLVFEHPGAEEYGKEIKKLTDEILESLEKQ